MSKVFSRLCSLSLSRRTLARVMAAVFFVSLIPLIVIACYNYPADDDFNFVLPAADAWVRTGSLAEVAKAIWNKGVDTYASWQGDFVSTALFSITPLIFDIRLYFLSNWFTLALLCLSAGYLIKGVVRVHLRADRATFWIVYVAAMLLALQFMPAIGWSIYWHNGGIYTVTACFLALLLGVLLRCAAPMTRARSIVRGVLALLLGFLLGGSFYGPMPGRAGIADADHRSRVSAQAAASLAQPGRPRGVRGVAGHQHHRPGQRRAPGPQRRPDEPGAGRGCFGAGILRLGGRVDGAPAMGHAAAHSARAVETPSGQPLRFRRPFWVLIALYGLYSAAIVPGVYTRAGYDTQRYLNALYLYFLIFAIGGAIYLEGAIIRWLEQRKAEGGAANLLAAAQSLGRRYCALLLAACVALTALGGFAFTIMNTSSLSAAKSLVTGEAARFREEMAVRQEYIRVTDSDEVDVPALSASRMCSNTTACPCRGSTERYATCGCTLNCSTTRRTPSRYI